ncbi:MAG: D-hexose-6-phosphate mutarotase [Methylococcales bacterium]|jgi:glucose-6-phosphate 1-epimerase|nr:D-hexose-6-phosphate mutarotase [Methylococcales bacterium]MBT7445387.1 D-hexose-6-phosphate mutarotase [Methylococcales bacterium]
MTIETIKQQFEIPEHITFSTSSDGFIFIDIENSAARAQVCLHGGHITAFTPTDQSPVIWVSKHAVFKAGKAIRGGVPICWPWFGDHPSDSSKPAHGIARTALWSVIHTEQVSPTLSIVKVQLTDTDASRAIWPHAFNLTLSVSVGEKLAFSLTAENTGNDSMTLSSALHTYFNISDTGKTSVSGLDSVEYLDKFDNGAKKPQSGDIVITEPTDRVYLNTTSDCTIKDSGFNRTIQVEKAGSQTTVVWNPWAENAAKMGDFGDDEYPTMICVEAANAADDIIEVAPGGSHTISQTITSTTNS